MRPLAVLAAGVILGGGAARGEDTNVPSSPTTAGVLDFLQADTVRYERAGEEAYGRGAYAEAASFYLAYLRSHVDDARARYNLACCYARLGEASLAAEALRYAWQAGYNDVAYIATDPDFDLVRAAPAFAAVVAEMAAAAGDATRSVVYVEAPAVWPCYVKEPRGATPQALLVGLHGMGSDGAEFGRSWGLFADPDFVFATPQAPYPVQLGSKIGFSWRLAVGDESAAAAAAAAAVESYVLTIIKSLRRRYGVDAVYLLGFSQGGGLALRMALKYPSWVRGAACFGGRWSRDWLEEADVQGDRPSFFIAHGRSDATVPFDEGDMARLNLAAAGYDVVFVPFDGGHEVPEDVLRQAQRWMAEDRVSERGRKALRE